MLRRISNCIILLLAVFGLFVMVGCDTGSEIDPSGSEAERQDLEKAVAYTAATVADLGNSLYGGSLGVAGAAGDETENNETENNGTENIASGDFSYDPNTGWWSFSVSLGNGQSGQAQVRFLDASGSFHKFPGADTETIQTKGEGSGPDGTFAWNFTFTGMGLTSTALIINGTGTANYNGTSTAWNVTDMEIKKLGDGIPEDGSISVVTGGVTFHVAFDGTETVQATYVYKGYQYSFTINLNTGQISS